MYVIRHKTVRKDCKSFIVFSAQELRTDGADGIRRKEERLPVSCAERQEISV
jgi:hypothetical protein